MNRTRSLLCALCAVITLSLSSPPAAAANALALASGGLHLYVSEPEMHRILRFALNAAGLPAPQPDAIITGLVAPSGLAIGPDRRLYVIDNLGRQLAIYEPAPGSGSKPSHVLSLPYTFGMGTVGVDQHDNVYVGYDIGCGYLGPCGNADVYAPLPTGHAKPFKTYSLGGSPPRAFVSALAFNAQDELAAVNALQTSILSVPKPEPGDLPLFCPPISGWGAAWGSGKELFETALGTDPQHPSELVVIPNYLKGGIPNCPASYAITSATIPLNNPYGLATYQGLLYATSTYNSTLKSALVFVFDSTKSGAQTPLAILGGPAYKLQAPYSLTIGP